MFLLTSVFFFRVSLSEAHARLNLRNKVLKEDVLIAALLFEMSLTLKYGNSVILIPSLLLPTR